MADVIFGVAVFSMAYYNLGLGWSAVEWAFLVMAVLCDLVIRDCILLLIGTLSFWIGRSRSLFQVQFTFNLMSQQWPIDVFGKWYRVFITGFLPVAFVNYYPLTYLLKKQPGLGPPAMSFLSPVVAMVLVIIATQAWRRGVASYTSAGN